MRLCIGATLVATIIFYAAAISLSVPLFLTSFLRRNHEESYSMLELLVGTGWWLTEIFLYSLLLAGQAVFFLKIARSQPATQADFFSGCAGPCTRFWSTSSSIWPPSSVS